MTVARKDAAATSLIGLAVLAFIATHQGWGVPLIGDSHRWATAVILVLGLAAAAVGATRAASTAFAVLGGAAVVLGALALATGSLTPLSLLVVDLVAAGALATWRHTHLLSTRPVHS